MKKQLLFISLLLSGMVYTQTPPSANVPGAPAGGQNSNEFWSRGGNTQQLGNNTLGTRWNSPIYTMTSNQYRMKLNGSFGATVPQYTVNGYTNANSGLNTSGYLLLGHTTTFSQNLLNQQGAYSLLHLNGRDGTFVQEGGFRPWMKAGVTLTDNNDLSYIGLRKVGTVDDVTETVIAWSDNAGVNPPGPDDMVFRFTSGGNGNTTISSDLNAADDLDGRHIARFAPTGEFGLGNTFGTNPPGTPAGLYVRPQSLLHLSLDQSKSVWAQFTNQQIGQGANSGIRFGLLGNANNLQNGNGLLYNQENRHLLFSTNANTTQVSPTNTQERMRKTSVSAPTALSGGGYGVYNPGGINGNRTRVAISHNPANPITRPLSLLHLGYAITFSSPPKKSKYSTK